MRRARVQRWPGELAPCWPCSSACVAFGAGEAGGVPKQWQLKRIRFNCHCFAAAHAIHGMHGGMRGEVSGVAR